MPNLAVFLIALVLITPTTNLHASNAMARDNAPFGMAVIDVTSTSSCSITHRTYASQAYSEVIDERVVGCPAGTVIRSTPVASEQEAFNLGGKFVPLSGAFEADMSAVESAKAQLLPADQELPASASACNEGGYSRSLSYRAYDPGVTIYSTVYYWQEYSCASGLSSAVASLSWNADLYWRWAEYFAPGAYYYNSHGCTNLSTGTTSDSYYISRPLGYLYRDESINFSPCAGGWGDSYTGSVYLYAN
jgi:hypothetical protein